MTAKKKLTTKLALPNQPQYKGKEFQYYLKSEYYKRRFFDFKCSAECRFKLFP